MSYSLIKEVGEVIELFVSIQGDANRISKTIISVDKDGVCDDKFYAKDPQRSILIATIESYNLAKEQNIIMKYGSLGENILMDYNPYRLPSGTHIKLGEVILEISQHCTLCKSLSSVDSKLPKLLKDNRGIFVKVIHAGFIRQGDTIFLLTSYYHI